MKNLGDINDETNETVFYYKIYSWNCCLAIITSLIFTWVPLLSQR